jgi:hypothetical protein
MTQKKELDINHELLDFYGEPHHPSGKNLSSSQVGDMIESILKNMEVIDRDQVYGNYDIIFCQLQKDMFGLEKDSYILLNFQDSYENIDTCRVYYDSFQILYLHNHKNKELAEKLFKQEMEKSPIHYKPDILFITKKITFKVKVKVVFEYEE